MKEIESVSYKPWYVLLVLVLALGLAAAAFFFAAPASLVDWREIHAVVIESDDWGLAGFVPDNHALDGLDRGALNPGRFPAAYWGSTLEDSTMVADLAGILAGARGRDGLPAILQANYVVCSLALDPQGDHWRSYFLPHFPPEYRRPGMFRAVHAGIARGVWYPEYHAFTHYDPARRLAGVQDNPTAVEAARRGIIIFPGGQRAWELSPDRPLPELADELAEGLSVFERTFGRRPDSIIAPDYTWDSRMERLWLSHGLHIIQAKKEQRFASRGWGMGPRVRKFMQRKWEKLVHRDRIYLERNCRFEPVQDPDPDAVVARCLQQVREAWRRGEPAVIEAHRINFVHTDSSLVRTGQQTLARLLQGVESAGREEPLFMTDTEVASLRRQGVSALRRGDTLVLRNYTRAARLVPLKSAEDAAHLFWMPGGLEVILDANSLEIRTPVALHATGGRGEDSP